MSAQQRLRHLIDQQQRRLRAGVPSDRQSAILAILRVRDRFSLSPDVEPPPDLVTGRHIADLGGNKALQLCVESDVDDAAPESLSSVIELGGWAERFLQECGRLAEAELVLTHCETGFMRLVEDGNGRFDAWIATKRVPTSWRERADIDWWDRLLTGRHEVDLRGVHAERPDAGSSDLEQHAFYRRLADVHLNMLAYQLGYPPEAVIGGCMVQTYLDVLGWLIGRALRARDRGEALTPRSELALVHEIASDLEIDSALVGRALAAFTLDRDNAAWHAAVPGIAAAPVVRLDPDRLAWSLYGLTREPLLFLTRELRRGAAPDYHNAAHLREAVFRQDLYELFRDRRFVTSTDTIVLRRADRKVRTDVDAVVFDRKTGTLGVFELKSQDPFARSTAELVRQRDNFLYANRQVSGVLDWLNRHGADDLLSRVDSQIAKKFRVHKVYPFVLGRYLAHFSDGSEPDRRAAWGTWPQILRLVDGQPFRATDANPIASLFTRLTKDVPLLQSLTDAPPREIAIGASRLIVRPSFAAYQAHGAAERGSGTP